MLAGLGSSELAETDQEDLKRVQDMIMNLRRKNVNFVALPPIGAASGADYSTAQLQKVWETMRLGHKFGRKKGDVRAWIFSADLFPPNLAKHSPMTSISKPICADAQEQTLPQDH